MKILTIHADFIEFEAKKEAMKAAEKTEKGKKRVEECLVVFSAVEKADEANPDAITSRYIAEIKDIAGQVKATSLVLYPFVHLTPEPAKPDVALSVLKKAEQELKKEYQVTRAPFGWYKAFEIKCKGHPLSELSRSFGPEAEKGEKVSQALAAEKKLKSLWYILTPEGKLTEVDK